uniref:Fibronectin type-III domain-containing protein n=1 Tax=Eptatretus burgeri TaxID=7764 RepID=A0A8C4QHN2_EPTBU
MRAEGLNNEEYQAVIGNETVQYLVEDLEPATNYTFYLVAYMPLGASQMSEHITQHTLEDVPLRPPEPSLSSFSPWAIRVSWGQLPGRVRRGHVTAYRLWVRPAGSNAASGEDRSTAKIIDVPPEHDSWLAKGLQENTLYLLRFAAATQAGWGEPSGWVTHRTPKVTTGHVPMSPSLHLDILNCTTIRVTWKRAVEAGPEVKGFRLFYREQENPRDEGPILLPALGKHAHLLTKLKPLTSYQIRLAAYNDDGEGYEADQIARTPECLVIRGRSSPPPPPPHRLHAVGNGSRSVVLRWSAPVFRHAGRCNYTVRCNSVGLKNASLVQYLHTTQEGLIVGGLRPHTHYEFAVRLRLGVLVSPWSPVLFHTTSPEPPSSPPDGVRVASVGPSSVLLAWQPPTEPGGEILRYVVRYATASLTGKILGFWRKLTTRGAETLMRVDGLQPGKAYQFQIAAATAEGQGPFTEGTDFVLVDGQSLGFGLAGTSTNRKDGRATAITLGVCIALACIVLCLAVLLGRGWTRRARPKAAGNARVVQAHGAFHQPPHPEVLPFHGAGHEDSEEAGLMKDCRQTAQKDWKSRIFCLRGQDKDQSHSKRHVRQSSCDGGNLGLLLAHVASKGNVASTGACLESGSTSGCSSDHDPPSPPSSENSESSGGARFSQATLDGVLPNFTSPGDSDTQEDSGGGEEDEGVSPGSQHPKTSQAVLFNVPPLGQALAGPLSSHEAFSVSMPSLAQPFQALFLIPPRAGSCTVSVPT